MFHHWKNVLLPMLVSMALQPGSVEASGPDSCCTIHSTPGSHHTAYTGDTVSYDLWTDASGCGGSGVQWSWQAATAGLNLTAPPPGSSHDVNVYIRFDAPKQSRWVASVRLFNEKSGATVCNGSRVLGIEVPDGIDLPDLVPEFVDPPATVEAGPEVVIETRTRNVGLAPAYSTFSNSLTVDGGHLQTQVDQNIPAGGAGVIQSWTVDLTPGVHVLRVCADHFDQVREENEFDCVSTTVEAVSAAKPNLLLSTFTVAPSLIRLGEVSQIVLQYGNVGEAASGPFEIAVTVPDGEEQRFWEPSLAVGQFRSKLVPAPGHAPGVWPVAGRLDPDDLVMESNEQDNDRSSQLTVVFPLPDLSFDVNAISLSPTSPAVGETVTFNVRARNGGDADIPAWEPVYIDVEDGPASGRAVCYGLAVGEVCERTFDVSISTHGTRTFTARLDLEDRIVEHVETDNQRSLSYNVDGPAITCQGTWQLVQRTPPVEPGGQSVFTSAGSVKANALGDPCLVYYGQNVPLGCWRTSGSGLTAVWQHDGQCPVSVTVTDPHAGENEVDTWTYDVSILP